MKKPEPKKKKPSFNWQDQKAFVDWWKEHRASGFAEDKQGRYSWGIYPKEAWHIDAYRMEYAVFTGTYYAPRYEGAYPYLPQDYDVWAMKQMEIERRLPALEQRLGKAFWQVMDPKEWYAHFKTICRELVMERRSFDKAFDDLVGGITKPMEGKIDEAYAAPYLSEEEQEALRRRRDDDENRD